MMCGNDSGQTGAARPEDPAASAEWSPIDPGGSGLTTDVIVVGGGVSGCACAAVLAAGGAHVLVVSSALDVVGLPGHGPVVESPTGEWDELLQVLASLPLELRSAWLETALIPDTGEAALVVDRRVVSIDSKRALEEMPGLQFRQALITDIRMVAGASVGAGAEATACDGGWRSDATFTASPGKEVVEVESAFGERLAAATVVLAPGLGLGGVVRVGAETLAGGRYGEVPATSLHEALVGHGVSFSDAEARVGDRYACPPAWAMEGGALVGVMDIAEATVREREFCDTTGETLSEEVASARARLARLLCAEERQSSADQSRIRGWPEWFPPAPHVSITREARLFMCAGDMSSLAEDGQATDLRTRGSMGRLWPDGVATGEYYLSLGGQEAGEQWQMPAGSQSGPATRLGYMVRACTVAGLGREGRLPGMGSNVWVAGQAAGCQGYLESLRSGVSVGHDVLHHLIERGCIRG